MSENKPICGDSQHRHFGSCDLYSTAQFDVDEFETNENAIPDRWMRPDPITLLNAIYHKDGILTADYVDLYDAIMGDREIRASIHRGIADVETGRVNPANRGDSSDV